MELKHWNVCVDQCRTDKEVTDWMRTALAPPTLWRRPLLDLTLSHPYIPELGFSVAVDGAARIGRALPATALTSVHPPGAFYQDHPISDDVKVSLGTKQEGRECGLWEHK